MRRACEALEAAGAFAYAEQRMADFLAEAEGALAPLPATGFHARSVEFYRSLIEFIGKRRH